MNTFFHYHTQSFLLVFHHPCKFQTLVSNTLDTFLDTQILLNQSLCSTYHIHYALFLHLFDMERRALTRISPS